MIIHIKVIPNSREESITLLKEGNYRIKVSAKAIERKANERVIEMLAKYFKVAKNAVIIKNQFSRKKIVEIVSL